MTLFGELMSRMRELMLEELEADEANELILVVSTGLHDAS